MANEIIYTTEVMAPIYPYLSQGIVVSKPGRMVFISGQTWDPGSGRPGRGDVKIQTRETLENIKRVVEKAGGTMADIVKVTVFVRNLEDMHKIVDIRLEYFKEKPPASTLVEISKLWNEDVLIEIDAIAVIP
jgi:2-iminobutanoate/2-iminopropanoate deaminase